MWSAGASVVSVSLRAKRKRGTHEHGRSLKKKKRNVCLAGRTKTEPGLYLQTVGSDSKSAKYFSSLCKLWNVYLQGYLQHTALFPEDESSSDYVRHVWGGLWIKLLEENVRGAKNTAEPSQTYWFSVTLFHNWRRYLVEEPVNLNPSPPHDHRKAPVDSQLRIDGGRRAFAATSVSSCLIAGSN